MVVALGALTALPLLSWKWTVIAPDAWPVLIVCAAVERANDTPPTFSVWVPVVAVPLTVAVSVGNHSWLSSYSKLAELEPAAMVMLLLANALPDVSRNLPVLEELLRLTVTALLVVTAVSVLSCNWTVMAGEA